MPSDLTIFAASYLIYIDGVAAALLLGWLLYRQPHTTVVRWVIAAALMLVVGFVLAQIGAAVYNDPRPFTTDHVKPLIPHAPDNGFPSDHGLLAAAIVAAVALAEISFALPFVVVGVLVDWARVGAGIHHVADVVGSALFIAVGTLVGLLVTPTATRFLAPRLPNLDAFRDRQRQRSPETGKGRRS